MNEWLGVFWVPEFDQSFNQSINQSINQSVSHFIHPLCQVDGIGHVTDVHICLNVL